jgi:hypothetical protein
MTTREFAAQALQLVLPLFLTLISVAIAYATNWVRTHFKITAQNAAVDAVQTAAETAVSAIMQSMVASLRDPTKPGTWNEVAAESAKAAAIEQVRLLSAQALDRLKASNWSDAQRRALVEGAIERAVIIVKSRTGAAAAPAVLNGHAS